MLKVVIKVTDINDNYPEFDQINYVAGNDCGGMFNKSVLEINNVYLNKTFFRF